MKLRPIFFSLLVALVGVSPLIVTAMQDEDVRGAFMTTRPKVSPKPTATKTSRRRPKPVVSGHNPNPGPTPSPVTPQKLVWEWPPNAFVYNRITKKRVDTTPKEPKTTVEKSMP